MGNLATRKNKETNTSNADDEAIVIRLKVTLTEMLMISSVDLYHNCRKFSRIQS